MISEIKKIEPSNFLLAIQREGTVQLEVDKISKVNKSNFNDGYYMYVDFKVLSSLIYKEENLKDSVVGIAYPLTSDEGYEGYFKVTEKQKIYPLLKYAINKNGHNIQNDFRLNEKDIKENLEGLQFIGQVESKNNHSIIKPIK